MTTLEHIWVDARYALRTMRKKPALAATAVIALALAVGGNTAVFTVIRAVLLKPLQYTGSDKLVRVSGGATPTRFADMQAETVYVAFAQNPLPSATLAIRTAGDPLHFANAVREQVRTLDKDQGISAIRSMEDLVEQEVGQRRLLVILLGSFAAVAVLLAVIGIYGVIAYSVAQRSRELGIRRALGAQRGDILRLVVGQGMRLSLAGVALGLAGAYGLTRLMQSVLFHISPTDPATFAIVALLFVLMALAASYIPARRATRIDPLAALRTDLRLIDHRSNKPSR